MSSTAPILEVRDLVTAFDTDAGRMTAVDGIRFDVPRGKTFGIVGESGCGNSRMGRFSVAAFTSKAAIWPLCPLRKCSRSEARTSA